MVRVNYCLDPSVASVIDAVKSHLYTAAGAFPIKVSESDFTSVRGATGETTEFRGGFFQVAYSLVDFGGASECPIPRGHAKLYYVAVMPNHSELEVCISQRRHKEPNYSKSERALRQPLTNRQKLDYRKLAQ